MLPAEGTEKSIFDQNAYQLSDLSYLAEESEWLGENSGIALMSLDDTVNSLAALQTGTYRNMQPVIGSTNDTPVMVWTRTDASRSATNEAQVVYSVFQNDAWSVPQPVDPDNTTADGVAKLATAPDGTLYVIYQNADTALSDNTTASEYTSLC